jgi:hypothetical protein
MSPTTARKTLADQFIATRKASVPLVVVRTNDPAATMTTLANALLAFAEGKNRPAPPMLRWDNIAGLQPGNMPEGGAALTACLSPKIPQEQTIVDVECFTLLKKAPQGTVAFVLNAHLGWKAPQAIQAIWNLRDVYKASFRTLVLMTPPGSAIPTELQSDVVTLEEPLPTKEQLDAVVRSMYEGINAKPDDAVVAKSVDALAGARSTFLAEQVTALCMTNQGVDLDSLWGQKKQLINDTPGLTFIEPRLKFSDLGGADALKEFFKLVFTGEAPPSVIVFIDEIDDMFAGVGGDSSGVATALHGKFLTSMTKTDAKGAILMGHPGVGKSAT